MLAKIGFSQAIQCLISEDIFVPHVSHMSIESEDKEPKKPEYHLYADDIKLDYLSWDKNGDFHEVRYQHQNLIGCVQTDFQSDVVLSFEKLFNQGDSFSILPAPHNAHTEQKVITAVMRFVIDQGNRVDIYTVPPVYKDPERLRINRIG